MHWLGLDTKTTLTLEKHLGWLKIPVSVAIITTADSPQNISCFATTKSFRGLLKYVQ